MILKPQGNFFGNGILRGTIVAYDDLGEPLGWESYGNWSSPLFREKAAADLAGSTGINIDRARAMLAQVQKVARKEADAAPEEGSVPERREMKARLPGLVDIVALDDGTPAFLFVENGLLVIRREWNGGGVLYVPPSLEHLPYLLPREAEVKMAFRDDNELALFKDLINWHKKASKLADEGHYRFIALYDFHTYLADRADYSPYLVFQTVDAERGKTRQGSSVAWVAYRGIVTETLQEANLFRWADSLGCALFFDVKDILRKAERRGSEDILLGRYQRHGQKVARTLDPQAGPFRGVVYYDVFGPTIMAVNEPLREPFLSRSIIIVPPEATGKYLNLHPEDGRPLKERLVAFRARHLVRSLPEVPKPVDGRLGDILQPIGQIAALIGGEVSTGFPELAHALACDRMAERAESREARIIQALEQAAKESVDDRVPVAEVAAAYNEGLGERAQLSQESVGKRLKNLGFKSGRLVGGGRARIYDAELVAALRRKFGLDLVENGSSTDPSLLSQPSLTALQQRCDGCVTDKPTVVTDDVTVTPSVTRQEGPNQVQNGAPVTVVTVVTDGVRPLRSEESQYCRSQKPDHPCYTCGSNSWWWRERRAEWGSPGQWVCGVCHPNPGTPGEK